MDLLNTILVVEDDDALRGAVRRSLERLGHAVEEAGDGAAALERLAAGGIDVVLTDINMPRLNGHALMRRMRQEGCDLPVVVMAGAAEVDDAVTAFRSGAVDFLQKPFDGAALCGVIEQALSARPTTSGAAGVAPPATTPAPRRAPSQTPGFERQVDRFVRSVTPSPRATTAGERPGPTPGTEALLEEMRAALRDGRLALPMPPPVVARLQRAVKEPGAGGEALLAVLEADQELALKVMSLANSAAVRGAGPATDLRQAASRLGGRMVLSVAAAGAAERDGRGLKDEALQELCLRLWWRSVLVAKSARILSRSLGQRNAEEDYFFTFVAEIGEPLLLRVMDQLPESRLRRDPAALADEVMAHHASFGSAVLERWSMGDNLVALARYHHADKPLVALPPKHQELAPQLHLMGLARHALARTPHARWLGALGEGPPERASIAALGMTAANYRNAVDLLGVEVARGGMLA